jgi:hypothetical protein
VATIIVIVTDVATYEPDEVAPTKDDYVLKEFPPAAADPTLRHTVLPRTAVSNAARLYAHRSHNIHHSRVE